MVYGVASVSWVQGPKGQGADIVNNIQHGKTPKRRRAAHSKIWFFETKSQSADDLRIAGHARERAHAVAIYDQPIGPQIPELRTHDLRATRAGLFRRNTMMGPLVAQQEQMCDGMSVEEAADVCPPAFDV